MKKLHLSTEIFHNRIKSKQNAFVFFFLFVRTEDLLYYETGKETTVMDDQINGKNSI
jgi:hypothetical protein